MSNPEYMTYTNEKLQGEHGDTIRVRLVDATTGELVTEGPKSAAELDVVPLLGDFDTSDEQDWTTDTFESSLVTPREGKGPLLYGELKVHLKGGVGTLGSICFTDNASWTRSKQFRLGVSIARDNDGSIREGKSRAIFVKDTRSKGNSKPDVPSSTDKVWRLHRIGKIHQEALEQHGISSVEDFLRCLHETPEHLKKILGKMPAKDYEDAVNHARKCVMVNQMDVYPVNEAPFENALVSHNYQRMDVVAHGQYVSLEHGQLVNGNAYENWSIHAMGFPAQELPAAEINMAADGAVTDVVEHVEATLWPPLDLVGCSMEEELDSLNKLLYYNDTIDVNANAPTPQDNRLWLRIRAAVRCAFFMRNAGNSRSPRAHHHLIKNRQHTP